MAIALSKRSEIALVATLLALISFAAYGNVLRGEFVYDDEFFILENPAIKNLRNIGSFFTSKYALSDTGHFIYRPLRTLSYAIDYYFWGLNPFGYHLWNLLLHIMNGVLLYIFLDSLFRKKSAAVISAAIFAVHPVQTDAVSWISSRGDIMYAFFFLLSILLYMGAAERIRGLSINKESSKRALYSASVAAYGLSLISKEAAITLPLAIILIDKFAAGPSPQNPFAFKLGGLARRYGLFLVISLIYMAIRTSVLGITAQRGYWGGSFYYTALTMAKAYAYYIKLLLFPADLRLIYEVPVSTSLSEPTVLVSLLILAAFIAAIYFYPFLGLWFFVNLLPVSNILPIYAIMREHFLYLPSIAFFSAIGLIYCKVSQIGRGSLKLSHLPAAVIIFLILVFYGTITHHRNNTWRSGFTLWTDTMRKAPRSPTAHNNLGNIFRDLKNVDKSISEYITTLHLAPANARARHNLALAYQTLGFAEKSLAFYTDASNTMPGLYQARANAGNIYRERGLRDKALFEFLHAFIIKGDVPKNLLNLANAYADHGLLKKAEYFYNLAVSIDAGYAEAYHNLAQLKTRQGIIDAAIDGYLNALRANNHLVQARLGLGSAYKSKANYSKAIAEFKTALAYDQRLFQAYNGLAMTYNEIGLLQKAQATYETALKINPSSPETHKNLSIFYLQQLKDREKAVAHLKESLRLAPAQPEADKMRGLIEQLKR